MTFEEMLDSLIDTENVERLEEIQDALRDNSDVVHNTGQMAPGYVVRDVDRLSATLDLRLGPTVQEGGGLINLANRIANGIRLAEYRSSLRKRPERKTVVAEGDSWFLHQLITDTLDHLHEDHFNVRSMAAAGDTVANMLAGTQYIDVIRETNADVFLFSGGGNDLLGDGRIARVLLPHDDGFPVDQLVNQAEFGPLLDRVLSGYTHMLRTLAQELPGVRVFSHGYDYLAKIDKGPWIWPYLEEMGYSQERAKEAVIVLLNQFNSRLEELGRSSQNFNYIKMLNVVNQNGLNRGSWYDAIHPKSAGFERVANKIADAVNRHTNIGPEVDYSEGIVASGIRRPSSNLARRRAPDRQPNEAISWAYASRNLTDFESVRQEVLTFPPKSEWLRFRDPLVQKHIEDVRFLLEDPSRGQTEEQVATRMRTRPSSMVREAHVGRYAAAPQEPTEDMFDVELNLLEALFGDSEIEPVQVLLRGYEASRSVGRVQVMNQHGTHIGHGSGFLVAPGLFLTNQHVLKDADAARRSFIIFDDEVHLDGSLSQQVRFRITDQVFWSSSDADYAFCSVEPSNRDGVKLSNYGYLPLIQDSGKALNFEPVSIIQHPGGDPKAIAIRNSFIMGRVDDGVYYTTDTLGGSSGSPVLNREWQVVALHHRFVPHPTERGAVLANRGVRISHIFDDLFREQGRGTVQASVVLKNLMSSDPATEVHGLSESADDIKESADVVESGAYSGLKELEFLRAIAAEDADYDLDIPLPSILEIDTFEALPADPSSILTRLGSEGYRFIVSHEVSSKSYYNSRLRNPILPGEASGVTIGIGYDLGYKTKAEFRANWGDLLSQADLRELETCLGKTRSAAAAVLGNVKHIVVSYDAAVRVFERDSLPKVFRKLNHHFPDPIIQRMPSSCFAALVSLTFNRGASFQKSGNRFKEMRGIRAAILNNTWSDVPDLIRSMKRIWQGRPNVRGLLRRRDEEADLFEAGLSSGQHTEQQFAEINYWDPTPDGDEESTLVPLSSVEESARPKISASSVRWVANYENNPDYAHLPASAEGARFDLSGELIEKAIESTHTDPHFTDEGHLIVAIRGAALAGGAKEALHQSEISLVEQKPDHRHFRCVVAVYHRNSGSVSAFLGSTVPNRGGVASCANKLNGHGGSFANLLPVGCYELCVGTHYGSATVPTVLRLGTGPEPADAIKATVLRTANDGIYGTQDLWDNCRPKDNIHPAFSATTSDFSSLGCLTVPGSYSGGNHTGLWARFRETAGFAGHQHLGTRYNLLLVTGMELAAMETGDASYRLSHGSKDEKVGNLQRKLGVTDDGYFGSLTKEALTKTENQVLDKATGLYTIELERALGWSIFDEI